MQKGNKKSSKRQSRKHLIIIALVILAVTATIIIAEVLEHKAALVNPDDIIISENVIQDLIQTAEHEVPLADNKVSVEVTNDKIIIGEHIYPYFSFIMSSSKAQEIPVLKKRVPVKIKRLFNESKIFVQKFVQQYFDTETSEQILKQMNSIKLVVGDFTITYATAQSSFIYENQKIYMNPQVINDFDNLPDELLVFTMVHEWVHMIRYVTNTQPNFIKKRLNEAMTDVIAKAIYPYERTDSGSYPYERTDSGSYSDSYYYAYAFISRFKDDGVSSFFFGKSLPVDDKCLTAYAFIVEVMQDTIRPDGLSDKDAFLTLAQLDEDVVKEDALHLIK